MFPKLYSCKLFLGERLPAAGRACVAWQKPDVAKTLKFYKALIFYARLACFKGVHEIASLSWSFCIKTKGRNIKYFVI